MKYFFLDTEWADANAKDLVSLALIDDAGQNCFYAERDPLPESPTEFARTVVYSRLDRGAAALKDAEFCRRLRAFLGAFPDAFVLFDHANDGKLLNYALDGLDLPPADLTVCGARVQPNVTHMLRDGEFTRLFEDWFAVLPEVRAARRHNALVDAQALRAAFLQVTGKVIPQG
jgi:hypothetical protein